MVIGIVLSLGAIYAFIPIVIILILIGAAVGLTRGTDLFAALGIGALIGIGATAGKGGTGKGIAGPKVPKSTVDKIKAQGKMAGGAIKSSKGIKAAGVKTRFTAAKFNAARTIRAKERVERIGALSGGIAVGGLSGRGSAGGSGGTVSGNGRWTPSKAAADAMKAGSVRLVERKGKSDKRAAEKKAIAAARNSLTLKPLDPRLRFRGLQILPTKGMIRSERQRATASGGTRPFFQFQAPGAHQAGVLGKFIGERLASRLPASFIAGSKPLVEGGFRLRVLERKQARMEGHDAGAELKANERIYSVFSNRLHAGPNGKMAGFGEMQPGIDTLNRAMGVRQGSMLQGVTGSAVEDKVKSEVNKYSNYWKAAQKSIEADEERSGKKSKEKPMSYAAWAKAGLSGAQPPPPPPINPNAPPGSEPRQGKVQQLQVKLENLTSQNKLDEIDSERGKISEEKGKINKEIKELQAENSPEALARAAWLSDRAAWLSDREAKWSDRAAELSRKAMKNSEKAVEVSSQLEEAEAKANLKSQQRSWYEKRIDTRLEKLDAMAEGGSDAAAVKAVRLRELMAKMNATSGREASGAPGTGPAGAEQGEKDKKTVKPKPSEKTKEGESTVDELKERQAKDEEARRLEEDRRKRQEA